MKTLLLPLLLIVTVSLSTRAQALSDIPTPLVEWQDWATWNIKDQNNPPVYNNPKNRPGLWPSRLTLNISKDSGTFSLEVTSYGESWITLPGNRDIWPQNVKLASQSVAVTEHNGKPAVFLSKAFGGTITGSFRWTESPQRFQIPIATGLLKLTVNGKANPAATWDAGGTLWLKNRQTTTTQKDFISSQVYRLMRDGIPMWLTTEIELTVSGKSREESIGHILPAGWKLSALSSPIPVAVDKTGLLKAQVRAGKWTIRATAFHLTDAKNVEYAASATPAVGQELLAFQSKPEFRLAEITGIPMIDASQTTLPQQWHQFPVYQWNNQQPFQIEERMRGMGIQKPEGLKINRELWLDQHDRSLTFRDFIRGNMQEIWRLDIAKNRELGSVRIDGDGQLVTLNPQTEAKGVEIRKRNLNIEATGRMPLTSRLSATGWQTDADSVHVSMSLPPGWRLFHVFGADWQKGNWLTSWTLLDLFLLLVFSIAVAKLWNLPAGILAFVAFGLSYHEPNAPRFLWFFLLAPLALQGVLKTGKIFQVVIASKYVILTLLVLTLIPFTGKQLQSALYPQLEKPIHRYPTFTQNIAELSAAPQTTMIPNVSSDMEVEREADFQKRKMAPSRTSLLSTGAWGDERQEAGKNLPLSNLLYDKNARIQTGPGIPEWSWNTVSFGWNGPVTSEQNVHPVLIPLWLQRFIIIPLRIALLILLIATLVQGKIPKIRIPRFKKNLAAVLFTGLFLAFSSTTTQAEIPDKEMLDTLRERLLEISPAFPNAAEIPQAAITLRENKVTITAEIHAAASTAIPLPGRLSSWSPLSVTVNGKSQPALRRNDGFLWIVLDAGVHQVRLEGMLAQGTEWEWTFMLRPRQVTVDAPGWNYTGIKANRVPESQIFFSRKQETTAGEASYDHHETEAVVMIERYLETGLTWKVRTQIRRLSSPGKAVSIRIPMLPGENVLSSNIIVKDGHAEIRIGAQQNGLSWNSEITVVPELKLSTRKEDRWVESWHLTNSPVWNIGLAGLAPVFEAETTDLTPVWRPWPGESVTLSFSRPKAVLGETTTINSIEHHISLGARQRTSTLSFKAECSLGQDFPIALPNNAEVASVRFNQQTVPARMDNGKLMVALKSGSQNVEIKWTEKSPLGLVSHTNTVQFPVEVANIRTRIKVPDNRWTLWTHGSLQGPAVRFWVILSCSLLAAWILSKLPHSPLRLTEWLLLALGLTQIHLLGAVFIAGWFFLIAWRGRKPQTTWPAYAFNFMQVALVVCTVVMIALFVSVISQGLLGDPDMFIKGNGSSQHDLKWYQPSSAGTLPEALCVTVSIWFYRLLMLFWALWLAFSLIRWMKWGWLQFSEDGYLKPIFENKKSTTKVPPLPKE